MQQSTIVNKLSRLKSQWSLEEPNPICECCREKPAVDMDHTLAQKRCKELHKEELIFDKANISRSCRECHNQWESYKSGLFEDHANVKERMLFVKKHDPETFEKRMVNMSNDLLMKYLRDND